METGALEFAIRDRALELGYESCGIIRIDALREYAEKLEERIRAFPNTKPVYEPLFKYAYPDKAHDWAKSVIVCVTRYGKYEVPPQFKDLIARYYLYDYKLQKYAREFENNLSFENFLKDSGLKIEKELHGITAGRWAASMAGLGIVRRNNFLYTKSGSWVYIDTWLTDREMELHEDAELPPCPEGCRKCMEACPTGALSAPYSMDMGRCITFLTWGSRGVTPEPMREKMGACLYGCDKCQDACPMNKDRWEEGEEYPGLKELAEYITLEKIVEMDESTLAAVLMPKFWFIRQDSLWKWKCHAIRAMANEYKPEYEAYIKKACEDGNENIREMALWACGKLGI